MIAYIILSLVHLYDTIIKQLNTVCPLFCTVMQESEISTSVYIHLKTTVTSLSIKGAKEQTIRDAAVKENHHPPGGDYNDNGVIKIKIK